MAKNGFRVMDSDLHVVEPSTLWDEYLDPKFRGRIVTRPDGEHTRAYVDGKVLPPYADRPDRGVQVWNRQWGNTGHPRVQRGHGCRRALRGLVEAGCHRCLRPVAAHGPRVGQDDLHERERLHARLHVHALRLAPELQPSGGRSRQLTHRGCRAVVDRNLEPALGPGKLPEWWHRSDDRLLK